MFAKPQKTSGSSLLKNKDLKKLRKDVGARLQRDDDAKLMAVLPAKVRTRSCCCTCACALDADEDVSRVSMCVPTAAVIRAMCGK